MTPLFWLFVLPPFFLLALGIYGRMPRREKNNHG